MNRRDFLKASAITGAAIVMKPGAAADLMIQSVQNPATGAGFDLVAIMGGEPQPMFRQAIAEMGGMRKFIQPGWQVVVKPNIAWDIIPERAANTNPELVGDIVRHCLEAGAREVIVFDHTVDEWRRAYATSGIEAATRAAGGRMMQANQKSFYRSESLPEGKILKSALFHQAIVDCDAWINVPVLKHHSGTHMTIAMKNYMGIVWDRRFFHWNGLQQCIADSCTYSKRPVLNIVDAYRVVKANGPRGRSEADVVTPKALFISQDIVAADTAAARFFNQIRDIPVEMVSHIAKGQALNLGTMNIDQLSVKRIIL